MFGIKTVIEYCDYKSYNRTSLYVFLTYIILFISSIISIISCFLYPLSIFKNLFSYSDTSNPTSLLISIIIPLALQFHFILGLLYILFHVLFIKPISKRFYYKQL